MHFMTLPDQDMAARLRMARAAANLDDAVAGSAAVHVPYGTYSCHENGARGFAKRVPHYARVFKVRADWLLTGRGSPTGDPVTDLYYSLPAPAQIEALRFMEFLHSKK